MFINTINCVSYNYDIRNALEKAYADAEKAERDAWDSIEDIEDENEYNKAYDSIVKPLGDAKLRIYKRQFAMQFPVCKNQWFASVVGDLPLYTDDDRQYKMLSYRQKEVFSRYVRYSDSNCWRSHEYYCRVGEFLVTIRHYKNGSASIQKESIAL